MTRALINQLSKSWFSNYDEPFAVDVRCSACRQWAPIRLAWRDLQPGAGGLRLSAHAQATPFVLTRHAVVTCGCGTRITLVLTGAAGGRQGEEQYGVAGLQIGEQVFT
jgi:hypothetical protein